MKRRTMMTTVGFAVLVAGLLVNAPAEANGAFKDRTTHLVLEHPVRVPGATLPAGHYLFTVDPSHRVVWIHNEDDSHPTSRASTDATTRGPADDSNVRSWSSLPRTRTVSPPSVLGTGASNCGDMSWSIRVPAATRRSSCRESFSRCWSRPRLTRATGLEDAC